MADETHPDPTSSAPPASSSDRPPSPSSNTAVAVVDELANDPRYDGLRPKPRERPSARPDSLEPPSENAAIWWEAIVQLYVCDVPVAKIARAINRPPAAVRRVLMTTWAERRAEEVRPAIRKIMLETQLDARAQFAMAAPHLASVMITAADDVQAKPLQRAIIAEKCLAIAGIQAEYKPQPRDEDLLDGLTEEQLESFVEGREIPSQLKPHLAPPIEVEATPVDEPAEGEG